MIPSFGQSAVSSLMMLDWGKLGIKFLTAAQALTLTLEHIVLHNKFLVCKIQRLVHHFSFCTTNQPQIAPFKILLK